MFSAQDRSLPLPLAALPVSTEPAPALSRAPLEWRVAPAAPDETVFGEQLLMAVGEALKCFNNIERLSSSKVAGLAAVARCKLEQRIAGDPLGCAYATRAVLREALIRLECTDANGAALLEDRYMHQKPIAQFEVEGRARATLMRHTRRALEGLSWELWCLEQDARREGYVPAEISEP